MKRVLSNAAIGVDENVTSFGHQDETSVKRRVIEQDPESPDGLVDDCPCLLFRDGPAEGANDLTYRRKAHVCHSKESISS